MEFLCSIGSNLSCGVSSYHHFFLCRMTLLLGPPGAGKTTLLLALAGKLEKSLRVIYGALNSKPYCFLTQNFNAAKLALVNLS